MKKIILSGEFGDTIFKQLKSQLGGDSSSQYNEQIKKLFSYINNYPETDYFVADLCEKVDITIVKLHEGFKLMYKCTVNKYIRELRIIKSEKLIKNNDLNILLKHKIKNRLGLTA